MAPQDLHQILDKVRAALLRDRGFSPALVKENFHRREADVVRIVKPVFGQPIACGLMQIVLLAHVRISRSMADDAHGNFLNATLPKKVEHTRKRRRLLHQRAVDLSLQLRPHIRLAQPMEMIVQLAFGKDCPR